MRTFAQWPCIVAHYTALCGTAVTTVKCYIATEKPAAMKSYSLQALSAPRSPYPRYILASFLPLPRQKPMKLEKQILNDPYRTELNAHTALLELSPKRKATVCNCASKTAHCSLKDISYHGRETGPREEHTKLDPPETMSATTQAPGA